MHDYVAQSLAQAHVADLHREAARHRAARAASGARTPRSVARVPSSLRARLPRLPRLHLAGAREPQCCPA